MKFVNRFIWWRVRRLERDDVPSLQAKLRVVKRERDSWMRKYHALEGAFQDALREDFRSYFFMPSLIGVWHSRSKTEPLMWHASYIDKEDGLVTDTAAYPTPWEALEAARNEQDTQAA